MDILTIVFGALLYLPAEFISDQSFLVPRRPEPDKETNKSNGEAGEPLILTPLVNSGNILKARNLSKVELMPGVEGNAAFLTVNKTFNSNLYFWFIRKTSADWFQAPLILWLQGGPGCSSLFGLFCENGPFFVRKSLGRRNISWTDRFNMLYIDQPVGTGFSFTDNQKGYVSSKEKIGQHVHKALSQFYELYPELRKNDFYIAGQSYAGKYVPAVGYIIHQLNQQSKENQIPLKGMFIGNGFSDPVNMLEYGQYLYQLGLIDEKQKREAEIMQEQIKAAIHGEQWIKATRLTNILLGTLKQNMHFISIYDYTKNSDEEHNSYVGYVTSDQIRKLLHVGNQVFDECSDMVSYNFESEMMKSVKPWIEELLEHYPMAFYSGQLDIIVAYPLTENFLKNLHWSAANKYNNAERKVWLDDENHVAGYYKSAGNLIEVLVRNAGHKVPADQPKHALDLLVKFVGGELK